MKISQSIPYIPLVQKPECCAVTCFQMILYKRTWKLFDLQDLAVFFGVKISVDNINCFNVKLKTLTNFNFDEWISTLDSTHIMNDFFKKNNLNFKATPYKYSEISDLETFIYENIKSWNDLWVEYHNEEIHPCDNYSAIHDNLIESIEWKNITLIDPEYTHKPRIIIKLETLKNSISNKYWKETWIIIIENV